MIATVSFSDVGDVLVHEGIFRDLEDVPPAEDAIATVPVSALIALDLFNEGRQGFDYDRDAGRCAELTIWALEDAGLEPKYFDQFEHDMITLCSPGGPTGGPFQAELGTW